MQVARVEVHTGWMARNRDLEPGQDDLVKEDKATANIKRALKRDRPKDDALYSDRAQSPGSRKARQARKKGEPGQPPQAKQSKQSKLAVLKQMWAEAVADAEKKQSERRAKR